MGSGGFESEEPEAADALEADTPRLRQLRERLVESIPCDPESVRSDLHGMPLYRLIFQYLNWADRLVRPKPRRVVTWGGFWRHGSGAQHMPAVSILATKIEAGEDLKPYLSDRVDRYGYVRPRVTADGRHRGVEWRDQDYALNAYETHHLHLRPTGSRKLLYVSFGLNEALLVMVGDHKSFDDGTLGRAVAEARVGTPYEFPGVVGLSNERSDRERNRLQRGGFATIAPVGNGSFVAGAMISITGMNSLLVMHGNDWMRALGDLEPRLDDTGTTREWFANAGRLYPQKPAWEWAPHYCDLVLLETSSQVAFPIIRWRR